MLFEEWTIGQAFLYVNDVFPPARET